MAKDLAMSMEGKSYGKDDATWKGGYSDASGDFEDTSGGMATTQQMIDYYNPTTGKYTQMTAGMSPKAGSGWVENPNSFTQDDQGNLVGGYKYGDPNQTTGTGKINEDSLDAWIGAGGALTQSSDSDAAGYYEGIDTDKAAELTGTVGLSDRDQKIYNLYTDVFGRNPDERGFQYWTSGDQDKMSLADIEASFKGSAEQKLRDNVSGTNNFVSTDDYIAGKQANAGTSLANDQLTENQAVNLSQNLGTVLNDIDNNTGGGNTTITQVGGGNNDAGVTTTGQNNTLTNSTTTNKSADEYLKAYSNLTGTTEQDKVNTINQTQAITDATTKAAVSNQQKRSVDNWLSDLYADLGINDGVVDQGGRDYWTEQLGSKSKAEVERDIKYAAGLG